MKNEMKKMFILEAWNLYGYGDNLKSSMQLIQ
jgi:hypothetical protein